MKNLINKVRHHGKKITIYLKSQPKWVVRCMFGIGAILGLIISLHAHPIGGTNAQSIADPIVYCQCQDGGGTLCNTNKKDSDVHHYTGNITYTDIEGNVFTEIGTITIQSGDSIITLLDRNLGASTNDIENIGSYGYTIPFSGNIDENTDESLLDPTILGIEEIINSQEDIQLCPDGFHIPSYQEWENITNMLGNDGEYLSENLLLPNMGLWSSSPSEWCGPGHCGDNEQAISAFIPVSVDCPEYSDFGRTSRGNTNGEYGIRCFYDKNQEYHPFIVNLYSGQDIIDTLEIWAGNNIILPTLDNLGNLSFNGWFTDFELTIPFDDSTPITENLDLYAKWSDTTPPTCDVAYSTTWPTNQDVVATLTGCSEEITSEATEYTFTESGTFIFEFEDLAGNTGEAIATVDRIDKFAPTCNIEYSTTGPTNQDVIATLTGCGKPVTVTNNDDSMEYTFENIGTFTFEFQDLAGNTGTELAAVTWIDKDIPSCNVVYSTTGVTTGNVTATLTCEEDDITVTNNDGHMEHTFENTGTFTFEFQDLAGNTGSADAVVTWINKTKPTCDVIYSTTGTTTGNVVASLTGCSETITGTDTQHTFTENGTYTFRFQDLLGNTGSANATVTWINKTRLTCDIAYNTTGATTGNVIATLTGCSEAITGTDTHHTFTENGTYTFRFQDLDGNTGEATATVTWIISGGNTTYFDVEGNIFRWNDLTICNPNKSGECITMMDRNLGATTNDISKTGSYGYHYQRGNNYGFTIGSGCRATVSQCSDEVTYNATTQQTNANEFGSNAPYTSRLFYKGHMDWTSVNNYNLRGGSGDSANNNYGYDIVNNVVTNVAGRQGPCPEGYHVPSIGERFKLLEYWKSNNNITGADSYSLYNSGVIIKFQEDLKIPFAGVRYYENAKTWAVGKKAYLWSSSPSYVDNMIHIQSESISFRDHSSAYGESVRCFKNPSNTGIVFSISFDDNIKPGEYATFTVKVLKDGLLYNNYTGTVLFTLTDKNGGLVNKKSYTIYNSGRYTFETSDSGRKIFYSGLKVNDAGTYILEIRGLRDGGRGSNFVFVGGKHNAADFEYDTLKFNPNYSDEMNQAYQYARYFDITTKNNIKNADMYSGLDRIAMAKMLTNYAENVLGKNNFNTGRNCMFTDVSASLNEKYDYGVTKACQLGIMGVNMPNNKFYPEGGVTRAEFATALSRLLYNTKDGTERYYSTHITKLRREGIITNTDPSLQELRGYVMLMLKRVAEK